MSDGHYHFTGWASVYVPAIGKTLFATADRTLTQEDQFIWGLPNDDPQFDTIKEMLKEHAHNLLARNIAGMAQAGELAEDAASEAINAIEFDVTAGISIPRGFYDLAGQQNFAKGLRRTARKTGLADHMTPDYRTEDAQLDSAHEQERILRHHYSDLCDDSGHYIETAELA